MRQTGSDRKHSKQRGKKLWRTQRNAGSSEEATEGLGVGVGGGGVVRHHFWAGIQLVSVCSRCEGEDEEE